MKTVLTLLTACSLLLVSTYAAAEDLRCSKIKDPQAKTKYVSDIRGLTADEGCTIKVPATMVCVPATKATPVPAPPGSSSTSTSNGFACYQTKCVKKKGQKTLPNVRVDDQFGDRSVTPKPSNLLCVPLDTPVFTCGTTAFPRCGGNCPGGQVCMGTQTTTATPPFCMISGGSEGCGCVDEAVACNGASCPSRICDVFSCQLPSEDCRECNRPGGSCNSDADCCFGKCDKGLGAVGQCVDERGRTAATP